MSDLAVRAVQLTKRYGEVTALDRLDLDVPVGSVVGLIGPNGAGKSTALSILATLLSPTSGSVEIFGIDPGRRPRDARRVVGYVPDQLGLYDSLSVRGYLEFFAAAFRIPRGGVDDLVSGLLELVELAHKDGDAVNTLSRGMKQRLSVARALLHDPRLLVLDEPASGLDPRSRNEFDALMRQLVSMGKTVVVSSHALDQMAELCTHVVILEAGVVRGAGTPAELAAGVGVGRVEVVLAGGERMTYDVADDAAAAALLKRLLEDGAEVVEFTRSAPGLVDAYLSLTEGVGS